MKEPLRESLINSTAARRPSHLVSSQIFRIPARSTSASAAAAPLPCLVLWHCKTTYSSVYLETWSLDSLQDFESVNKQPMADDIHTYLQVDHIAPTRRPSGFRHTWRTNTAFASKSSTVRVTAVINDPTPKGLQP